MSNAVTVQDFMSKKPIHLNENDTISFVINMFDRTHISGAPVVNAKGEYVGVISKTDLASATMLRYAQELDTATVRLFMTHERPLTLPLNAPLEDAVVLMLDKHVHRLFIEDDGGQIIGVLSSFDILRAIRRTESNALERAADKIVKASTGSSVSASRVTKAEKVADKTPLPAPAETAEPPPSDSEKPSIAVIKDKAERNREIEQRIFNLITKKQEQIMAEAKPAPAVE